MLLGWFDVAKLEISQREPEVKLGLIIGAGDFFLEKLSCQREVFLLHRGLAEMKVMKRPDGLDLGKPALQSRRFHMTSLPGHDLREVRHRTRIHRFTLEKIFENLCRSRQVTTPYIYDAKRVMRAQILGT